MSNQPCYPFIVSKDIGISSGFPFTIVTTVSREEYNRWMIDLTSKKRMNWITPVVGIILVVGTFIGFIGDNFQHISLFRLIPLLAGIALFLSWYKFRNFFAKKYDSNPRMHHPITYTFNSDGVHISGKDFKSEFGWGNVQKMKVMDEFILLYLTPSLAEIIKRSSLASAQVDLIRSKMKVVN